jgi:metal-responsive CopG/Arc/MetJ family transcriptional regulator
MNEKENVEKFTISMEKELRDWVDAKVKEMNRKDRRYKTSRSALISDAVQKIKDAEESAQISSSKPSKVSSVVGAAMATLSENLDSGPSTATKKHSRQAS